MTGSITRLKLDSALLDSAYAIIRHGVESGALPSGVLATATAEDDHRPRWIGMRNPAVVCRPRLRI